MLRMTRKDTEAAINTWVKGTIHLPREVHTFLSSNLRRETVDHQLFGVSVDSAYARTYRYQHGGRILAKLQRNLRTMHQARPGTLIIFLTTATSANIDKLRI
jgi:hypothetical protein